MAHIYEKNDRHMSDREIIKRTWPYVKPYAKKIGLVLFVMLIMIVLELLGVILPGYVTSSLGNLVKEFSDGSIRLSNMQKVFEICMAVLIVNLANSLLCHFNVSDKV